MKMKQLFNRTLVGAMLIGATVAGTSYTVAQNADRPHGKRGARMEQFKNMTVEERVDKRLARMKEKLALSDEQAAQIRAILIEDGNRMKNAHEARKAARDAQKEANQKLTKEQRQAARAEMKAQKQATKAKIEAILTAEQKAKAQTLLNERKEKMKKHMKRHRGEHGKAQRGAQEVPQGQQREFKQNQNAK